MTLDVKVIVRIFACLLSLALVVGFAFLGTGSAHAQGDEGDYVDVAVMLEVPDQHSSVIRQKLDIIVVNQGSTTAYDVEVVVDVVSPEEAYYFQFFTGNPDVPVGSASLESNERTLRWSIPALGGLQRAKLSRAGVVHLPTTDPNPAFDNSLIPHEYLGTVTTSSFESEIHKRNNTSRVWSYIYGRPNQNYRQAAGNYTVSVTVDEPSPSPGGAVNFTIAAELVKPTDYIGSDVPMIDTKIDIELTGGLTVSGTPTYAAGFLGNTNLAGVPDSWTYSDGEIDVGTLEIGEGGPYFAHLPVSVANNAVVSEQCLTATLTGNPPPGTGPRDDDISDNVAKVCLGDQPVEPRASNQIDAFIIYPCVGNTNPPCDDADDVRVRAIDKATESEAILASGKALVHVRDEPNRVYDSSANSVNAGTTVSWRFPVIWDASEFDAVNTEWTNLRDGFTASEPNGGAPPGSVHIRAFEGATSEIIYRMNPDTTPPWTGEDTVGYNPSSNNGPYTYIAEFEKLGTYKLQFTAKLTRATLDGDENCDPNTADPPINQRFCATETYIFHVGPMRDLAVEDGGASSQVAADQHALTIVPVNHGPDHSPGAQVTGLPTEAQVIHISQGTYDPTTGEWDVGELKVRGYYRSAGDPDPTLILKASASDTASVSIAHSKNYEVCIGGKDNPGDLAHTTKEACEADTATGVSWHSTPVYDYNTANNTATITAQAGAGGAALQTANSPASIIVTWDAVENLHGVRVTHYEIEWSADGSTNWTALADNVLVTRYVDTAPEVGDTRHYRVRPVNEAGVKGLWTAVSSATATVSTVTPPGKPTGLAATVSNVSDIALTWTAPSGTPPAATYDIQISEDGSTNWQPLVNGVTTITHTHSNVGYGVTRHYQVRARETQGQPGDWSDTDSATTGNPAPLAPANLSALPNGLNGIIVAWDAADNQNGAPITHYEVEWSADGNAPWTSLNNNVKGTSIVDTAPTAGTTRHYQVLAVNATGLKSPWSSSDSATAATPTLDAPGKPTGLTAAVSNVSGILLTWTAPSGGVSPARYEIEYSTDGNAPWTPLANNVTSITHTHSNVGYGVTRHYQVRAVNSEGLAGEWSDPDDATTGNPAPLAPANVKALPNGLMGIIVAWDAADRNQGAPITHYEVQWSADGNTNWTTLDSNVAGTSHIDTAPAAGDTRHYQVRAVNATSLVSPWSDSDSATAMTEALPKPGKPTGLDATVANVSDIRLSWTPSTDGVPVARYEIEYSADGSTDWRPLANSVAATATGYTDNGAGYGETRHYRIRAVNTEGLDGDWSDTANATTDNPKPGVPTNVMAVAQGLTGIIVSWNPPAAYQGKPVTHYEVEVSLDGNAPWTSRDDSISGNVYTHSGLSANDTRHYRVYAHNAAGRSDASIVVSVTIPTEIEGATAGPPGVPVVTAAPNGRTEIVLRWNKPVENGSPIISYDVWVSDRQNGPWTDAEAELDGNATSWTHTGLIGNTTRYYQVRAENHIDEGGWSDPVKATTQAPGQADAPLNLRAAPDGDSAIDLSWDPPGDDGGSPITYYQVQWSHDGTEGSWRHEGRTPDAETRTYKDTGLTFGTTRYYRVAARNSVTLGVWSDGVMTTTLSGVPGIPNLTVRAEDANTIALTWTVPADNGDPITGYHLEWSPDGTDGTWTRLSNPAAADTSHDDSGLDPGTRRYYRIRAVNDTGEGSWSTVRNAVTPPAVPSAPTLRAEANGENAISLSWDPPGDDGGADITQYEIQVSTDGGANYSRLTSPSASARSYNHTGLQPGDERHYQLRARNRAGWGELSQAAFATTLTGVPTAPSLTARANGASEIKLTWTKPDDRGSDIAWYQLQGSDDGNDWDILSSGIPASDTEYVHDGLSGGTTKYYRIRAINGNGQGQWSTTRSARTDAGGPDKPELTLSVISDNQIDLSWTTPADNGSSIRGYWVERSVDGNTPWERLTSSNRDTDYSDTSLYRGMTRYYRVAAFNQAGTGPYSEVKSATTTGEPAEAPSAPTLLRFSEVGRNYVTIAWDPPAADGGAPVSGYEYQVAAPCEDNPEQSCGFGLDSEKATTGASVRITGLNADGDYYFRVRAVNPVGRGEWASDIHALLRPLMSGQVRVSPTAITVDEGNTVSYTVRLSTAPPHPVELFVQPRSVGAADDLGDAAFIYTGSVLIPTGWTHPRGDDWSDFTYNWNQGVKVSFTAPEDGDAEDDVAVMDHFVIAVPYGNYRPCSEEAAEEQEQCEQDWEDAWAKSPYRLLTGVSVKVTVRDND